MTHRIEYFESHFSPLRFSAFIQLEIYPRNTMHHLYQALITVAPIRWQRFMADSRLLPLFLSSFSIIGKLTRYSDMKKEFATLE